MSFVSEKLKLMVKFSELLYVEEELMRDRGLRVLPGTTPGS